MKKLTLKAVSLILSLGVVALASAEDQDDTSGGGDEKKEIPIHVEVINVTPDFKVIADLPQVPDSLPVYGVNAIDPLAINLDKDPIARAFDFKPIEKGIDEREDGSVSIMFTDANHRSLEYFSSGAAFYMEEELFSERSGDILVKQGMSMDDAKRYYTALAHKFIDQYGLYSRGMKFKDVSFAQLKSVSVKSQEEHVEVIGAAAHFSYEIEGIPAWGPGAKTTVYYGPQGISGFYDAMPAIDAIDKAKTIHPEAAIGDYIEQGKAQTILRLHSGIVEAVIIDSMELIYYVDAGNKNQEVVAPQYLISGTFIGQDIADREKGTIETEFQWMMPAVY